MLPRLLDLQIRGAKCPHRKGALFVQTEVSHQKKKKKKKNDLQARRTLELCPACVKIVIFWCETFGCTIKEPFPYFTDLKF